MRVSANDEAATDLCSLFYADRARATERLSTLWRDGERTAPACRSTLVYIRIVSGPHAGSRIIVCIHVRRMHTRRRGDYENVGGHTSVTNQGRARDNTAPCSRLFEGRCYWMGDDER